MIFFYWIAIKTIWIKEITRFSRIWIQTLLPPVITTLLYFVIFGNLIGKRIGNMEGVSYIKFIFPGLIMTSVITNSYSNVCSSFFGAKFQKSIEELLVSPIPINVLILGFVGGGVSRGVLVAVLIILSSVVFFPLEVHSWFVIFITILMTSTLFSLAGLVNAIFAKTFDDISIIPTFILTPLTYLGGVFYSLSLLPSNFWKIISKVNPVVYMIGGLRYGFLGIGGELSLNVTLIILLIFTLILYYVTWYILKSGKFLKA
ncbi:ABC transporter permease [Candidatus Riesia pediculicola]|uniref:Transport permease protein n=1 Tax=Riesia pediculicola (strain USDA) TaxID=515618 RepID=D4G813_RIEPU|nr:ABC transporter permease [Candidatus Riesia pediculicola]ADD79854.1 ABC transporter, integral membrane protein YadH [Candidatus Riesia pediculicola USDA]ARC53721.1 ABC transporter permease [Candidatus Riesia pediculicola]QOJ86363.1 ABC transporter permease [Candidatus Riesia pediculicola]